MTVPYDGAAQKPLQHRMNVCFIASEVAPFAKTGGLGDVSGALPKYLSARGLDVRVFMPLYSSIDTSAYDLHEVEYLQNVPLRIGERTIVISVYTTLLPGSDVDVYLIHAPDYYSRGSIYTDHDDEYFRFYLLSHAALVCCQYMGWSPDIVHCNDWQTALVPVLLRTTFNWDGLLRRSRTVLTIHNIAYQGIFPSSVLHDLGLSSHRDLFFQDDLTNGVVSYMKSGILYADVVTAVSKTYAREIQTPEFGAGLDGLLRRRSEALIGIVNGIDVNEWNPEIDALIPAHYSLNDPAGKQVCKENLASRMELPVRPDVPLLGVVSRLTPQKGFDLFFECMEDLLERYDAQLAVLGSGEKKYENYFAWLQSRFPDRVSFYRGFSNELAHLIEAGADIFLMPSRFEPCGLNQLYSLKYGTIPVVRRTGGLADTVVSFDPATRQGTGFVFDHFTAEGLAWGIETALRTYIFDQPAWQVLMRNAMAVDYSWEHQIEEYLEIYSRLA